MKSMKGFQTLTLEGQALAALMNQQAKTRRWEGKSRADVVREVAKENGYAVAEIGSAKFDQCVLNCFSIHWGDARCP